MKWLQGYLDSDNKGKWRVFFDYYLERYDGKLLILSNLQQHDAKQLVIQDLFMKVIGYWTIINYCDENLEFESAYIWYNSLITIEKKLFFYNSWFNAGIQKVTDLFNKDNSLFSFDEFMKKFNMKTNYLEYFKVISVLKQYKNMCLLIDDGVGSSDTLDSCLPNTNTCRKVYQGLIEKLSHITSKKPRQMDERDSNS